MRISDWSSDVCSSDLIAWPGHADIRAGGISDGLAHVTDILPTLTELAGVSGHGGRWRGRAVEPVTGRSLVPMLKGGVGSVHGDAPLGYEQIGRASCRERVCQYA